MEKEKKQRPVRPVHQVIVPNGCCLLRASIWRHQKGELRPRFSISFTLSYLGTDGKTWVYSEFFHTSHMRGVARAAEEAAAWIAANDETEIADVKEAKDNE